MAKWMLDRKKEIAEKGWKSREGQGLKKKIGAAAVVVVILCVLSYTELFAKIFARNENTGIFNTYTQELVPEEELLSD